MIKSGLKENFKSSIVAATGSTGHSAARRGVRKEKKNMAPGQLVTRQSNFEKEKKKCKQSRKKKKKATARERAMPKIFSPKEKYWAAQNRLSIWR